MCGPPVCSDLLSLPPLLILSRALVVIFDLALALALSLALQGQRSVPHRDKL